LLPDKSGIDVDANAGQAKTEGDASVAQQANTAVAVGGGTKSSYNAPIEKVVNNSSLEWWQLGLIVLLAGWAIPSPGEMLRSLAEGYRQLRT
jgi:hypothetical protein